MPTIYEVELLKKRIAELEAEVAKKEKPKKPKKK